MNGIKHDNGKLSLARLPVEALEELAKVLEFGAKKYGWENWRGGMQWLRVASALLRHLFAFLRREDRDPESGLLHTAHIAACAMFLLQYQLKGLGEDDRYKGPSIEEDPDSALGWIDVNNINPCCANCTSEDDPPVSGAV